MTGQEDKPARKRRGGGRPTIADVAARAGVSTITVSRALRDPHKVSETLRDRIDQAVRALDYVPDSHASALASARTNVLGVVVPSLTNNVFSDTLRAIYDGLEGGPLRVQLGNSRYSAAEEERLLRIFLSQRPCALIVAGNDQTPAAREMLENADCPVVQIMEVSPDPVDMMVGFSHFEGGRAAGAHLIAQGYRHIGFLGARMDPRTKRRQAGFAQAMKDAGMYDPALIMTTATSSSVALGAWLLRDLRQKRADLDAVFCNNDDLALGALFECQRSGISVPDEFGISGFNDLEMMAAAFPTLTSVRTDRYGIGLRAVEMIRACLDGHPPARKILDLGFAVQARQSTARSPRD
ncbi:MAG: LacI family DNA-binding transcriptional regulator [Pseudomonadota bacterium]